MMMMTEPAAGAVPRPAEEREDLGSGFEAFFNAEHARLLRALYVITVDVAEAEDVMQEAFVKVWERWERVRSMEEPIGYLYRTAMNVLRSRFRRAAVRARRWVGAAPDQDGFGEAEARTILEPALAALTPRQREAIALTELLGYPSEEAGRLMRITGATVRVLAAQGRARLREAIGEVDA